MPLFYKTVLHSTHPTCRVDINNNIRNLLCFKITFTRFFTKHKAWKCCIMRRKMPRWSRPLLTNTGRVLLIIGDAISEKRDCFLSGISLHTGNVPLNDRAQFLFSWQGYFRKRSGLPISNLGFESEFTRSRIASSCCFTAGVTTICCSSHSQVPQLYCILPK